MEDIQAEGLTKCVNYPIRNSHDSIFCLCRPGVLVSVTSASKTSPSSWLLQKSSQRHTKQAFPPSKSRSSPHLGQSHTQIMLNPYVYSSQAPIMEYSAKHGIVIEGYSPLV